MTELSADVAVVGAGPAGLAAAAAAAEAGARVILTDEQPAPGGQIWRQAWNGQPSASSQSLWRRAVGHGVRWLGATTVFGAQGNRCLRAWSPEGPLTLRSGAIVLATGALERLLPFPGWTLPGVFGAGGLQALAKGGLEVAGRRIVLAGSGPLLLAVAAFLRRQGAQVVGIFEQAPATAVARLAASLLFHPGKLRQAAGLLVETAGIRAHHSAWPLRAEGEQRLERLTLQAGGRERTLELDFLGCGFGLVPVTGLAELLGCRIEQGAVVVDRLQRTTVPAVFAAGEAAGIAGADAAVVEGTIAGLVAAGRQDLTRQLAALGRRRSRERAFAKQLARAFRLRPELKSLCRPNTIVCRCEDVESGALIPFGDPREARLATRCGMGPCQGRVCGPALAFLNDWPLFRAAWPLTPVTAGALLDHDTDHHDPSTHFQES
jgi:NADPH-dependent 2,4-dienoyl-CoA reductase/sulfur reductase-like enzyme